MVRAHAKEWNIDPQPDRDHRLLRRRRARGAGGRPVRRRSIERTRRPDDPLAGVSSRPDFVGTRLSGPDAVRARPDDRRSRRNAPPAFITCAGSGDARARRCGRIEYFAAMLKGRDPERRDAHLRQRRARRTGLKDRNGTPFGTWQDRSSTGSATSASSASPASRQRRPETWPNARDRRRAPELTGVRSRESAGNRGTATRLRRARETAAPDGLSVAARGPTASPHADFGAAAAVSGPPETPPPNGSACRCCGTHLMVSERICLSEPSGMSG